MHGRQVSREPRADGSGDDVPHRSQANSRQAMESTERRIGGRYLAGLGLGGENAVQYAQCRRQAGGADCAESDQEA
jgi:hypothetical protein